MKDSFKKASIGMLAGIACMTASCAEFVGELYWAEWFSKYDCGFGLHGCRARWGSRRVKNGCRHILQQRDICY